MSVTRVAVIGGGAAGLCALRHLLSQPKVYEAVCFELSNRIGGTWVYTEETGLDENGLPIQSSMYKNLRTNLPKEVMAFPNYPFKTSLPSFIMHQDVLEYLESYAGHYNLRPSIKLKTLVKHVSPVVSPEEKVTWDVTYCDVANQNQTETENFHAIMVCNGHYAVPLIPDLVGKDKFKGQIIHSHNYRHPREFEGKRVVCLGAAASGQDIAIDLSSTAKQVYMSHNKNKLQTFLPANVEQRPGISELTENKVIFKDGQEVEVDVVMFCTGYHFHFPFLSESCKLNTDNERLTPLYKHLIHIDFPSLCFIGILKTICPFPMFDVQVRYFLAVLSGKTKLPSKEEMLMDTEMDLKKRLSYGMPIRYAHTMGPKQWAYNDELADLAKTERVPRVVQILYDAVHETRVKDIARYKAINYELLGSETYRQISP